MNDFVALQAKRHRGWPWPEDSWGLTPMYGEDGWCRSCGIPTGPQIGPLILSSRGFRPTDTAWIPNWRLDVLCLSDALADAIQDRFGSVETRPVQWRSSKPVPASQVVIPVHGESLFDSATLEERTKARHGSSGAKCGGCGVWRWYPLAWDEMPLVAIELPDSIQVTASPDWFGDGARSYRRLVFRRGLAEMIAEASARDFSIIEVDPGR
jgi:hypothetical protein